MNRPRGQAAPCVREPIAASWRRAAMAGLTPESALDHVTHVDVDATSSLLGAAQPVLDDLNRHLEGTMFFTLLVDREGHLTQRWCHDKGTLRAIDSVGIDVGASLVEEAVGTNALGTALETRSSITINGPEHFAVPLRRFSCFGHPIFHPVTKRLEGALDLSALVDEASPLLPPLVARAVADIEQRLLDGSRMSDRQLLSAFQAAGGKRQPVVAIGHDLLMSNQAAADLTSPSDIALMRMIAADVRGSAVVDLALESGVKVRLEATRVGGQQGGTLLKIGVNAGRGPLVPARSRATPPSTAPILVCGPPGSGRSTKARQLAPLQPVTVLTGASAQLDGTDAWARNFAALLRSAQGTVCIDGIDVLPTPLLDLVATHASARRQPRLVLVSGPAEQLTGEVAALAAACPDRVALAPLTARTKDLPELVRSMLLECGGDPSLHFVPSALQALAAQPWPGNLRELRSVIEYATQRRTVGALTLAELPEAYRTDEPHHALAPIEQAERTVIVEALREHDGNKVKAAQSLGISRTTLYAKMRTLRITCY